MAAGFLYPAALLTRRHGPKGYSDLASCRPWLRDDFNFRCVYCLIREQWGRAFGEFELDHFVPQSLDESASLDYDNLLYSCHACNLVKGAVLVPDPATTLVADQIIVHEDGAIEGLSEDAERLIRYLDLDDEDHRRWRRIWIRIIELSEHHDPSLYRELMLVRDAGGNAEYAWDEYFAIDNDNTRLAYESAVRRFLKHCQEKGLALDRITTKLARRNSNANWET